MDVKKADILGAKESILPSAEVFDSGGFTIATTLKFRTSILHGWTADVKTILEQGHRRRIGGPSPWRTMADNGGHLMSILYVY